MSKVRDGRPGLNLPIFLLGLLLTCGLLAGEVLPVSGGDVLPSPVHDASGPACLPETACAVTCYAGTSAYNAAPGQPVQFTSIAVPAGCAGPVQYLWNFGDGATSTEQNPSHAFPDTGAYVGVYNWTLTVSADGTTCTKTGSVSVHITYGYCTATAPYSPGPPPLAVNFTGTSSCPEYGYTGWNFGDGTTASGMSATHTYTQGGVYKWCFASWMYMLGDCWSCGNCGDIIVLPNCVQVGDLSICGQTLTKDPTQHIYTLSGNVSVNGVLFFSSDAVFTGDPATGHGTLTTAGNIFVKLKGGTTETLLKGPGLSFDANGAAKTLTPSLSDVEWAMGLAGLPLWLNGKPITFGDKSVTVEPTLFVGTAAFTLASFKAAIEYKHEDTKRFLSAEVIEGQLTPGIQFMSLSGSYDYDENIFTGSVSIGFPFMGTWSVSATIRIMANCSNEKAGLNGFDIAIGLPDPIPIGTTGLGIAGFVLKVDNICVIPKFFIFFGGDLGIAEVPGEVFTLSQMGVGYQRPYMMVLEAGTANLLGYPVGSLSGRISFKPGFAGITFKGWVNFAGVYQSQVNGFLSVSKKTIAGGSKGTLQIPDFSCSWYNVPCRTVKSALKAAVSLPFVLNGQEMDMVVSAGGGGAQAMFRGMQQIGPLTLAVILQYANGDFDLLVGPNYSDVIGIGSESAEDSRAVEKSVTLSATQPQALFSVAANSESSALPAITLKNPQGATITPSNAGSYPGVHYTGDESLKVALFRLDEAAAGTWTLAVSNLSGSEVTFQCLVPAAAPATSFTSVVPGSGTVAIQASVNPTSPTTKVSLYFSDEASGGMGQAIAENLPAASGSVSASWNTAGVAQGSYYLFARTDDGKNPPLVTYYGNPVTVGAGTLQPPTNLSGSYSGTACDLSWTASPSAGVSGYRMLYTDVPAALGYPFAVTAPVGTSARVEGLAGGGQYRFAAVAFDASGGESAPSEPWYAGSPPPADVRELQSAIPVSDSVAQGAWKYYKIAVPAEPISLEAFTGATSGDVDLYLKKGSKPGSSDYDYRASGASGAEKIAVTQTSSPRPLAEGDWYLGVNGKQAATFSAGATAYGGSRCAVTCSAAVPPSSPPGTPVSFQGQASTQNCSEAVVYTWTFGDKTAPVTGQNPSHTYTAEGTYTWTLTALSGESGGVSSGTILVTSGPVCTVACNATVPSIGSAGSAVPFRATATASNCSGSPAYAWTFGDGATSNLQNPDHAYASAGSYPWTLTVSVAGAAPCTRGGTIAVGSACTGPSISAHPQPQTIPSGQTAMLGVTAAGTAPLSYQWYQGASGNTSAPVGTDSSSFTSPPLTATTSYWVRVTNACNHADSSAATVTVETGCVLTCAALASPASGAVPLSVAFSASATPVNCISSISDSEGGTRRSEASTPLTSGVPVNGSVGAGAWAFYKIAVPADATRLEVKTAGTVNDLDLYVRFGAEPTSDLWDYRPYTPSGDETVTVTPSSSPRPLQGGDWYIGVYGFVDGGSFAVTATSTTGGGTSTVLTSGVPVSGSVTEFGWAQYSIEVSAGASQLEIQTTDASADMDLYIRYGTPPDSDNWDYRPYSLEGNETVTVTPASTPRPLQPGTWFIGVHSFWTGTFTLTATVSGGSSCTLTCTASAPPTGTAGDPVAFASTATPADCAGGPVFSWTFGDGQTSSQQNPSHRYANPGTYTWSLTVTAGTGTCNQSGGIDISSPGGTTFSWTFGDGQTSTQQNPTHIFADPGTFSWSVTASWNGRSCAKSGSITAAGGGAIPGDCDGDGTVSIGEVQKAINMFLGTIPPGCGVDCNGDGTVSIGEVQKAINGFLGLAGSC